MENDKMKILKLLEEGKITADEAAKLLNATGSTTQNSNPYNHTRQAEQNQYDHFSKTQNNYSGNNSNYSKREPNHQQNNGYNREANNNRDSDIFGMESFADELGKKFETIVKDFEPLVQKFTEIVVDKTAAAADVFQKSFYTQETQPQSGRRPAEHPKSHYNGGVGRNTEKNIELRVLPGNNELIINGLNAPLLLKGYNGDKISAKISCIPKKPNAKIDLSVLGSKYFLDYNEDDFEKVAIDAFVPETLFKNIIVSNYNGDLNLSSLSAEYMNIYTSNSTVSVDNVRATNIKIESENGKQMNLSNIYSENGLIENYNGSINAYNLEIQKLKLSALNGAFSMNVAGFSKFSNYMWSIETSNHRLSLNLPTFSDVGYYIKAKASLGNIRVGVTGLNYILNSPNIVEAKTVEFDYLPIKVNINLETSNAQLIVN